MNDKDNPNIYVPSNVQKEIEPPLNFDIWCAPPDISRFQEFIKAITIESPKPLIVDYSEDLLIFEPIAGHDARPYKDFWKEIMEEIAMVWGIKKSDEIL